MIVYELTGAEENDEYKRLEYFNTDRQLHFLESLVHLAVNFNRTFLSQTFIKALNFHAIACLHTHAGEYRPCEVQVGGGGQMHLAPEHYRVDALMDDLVNFVNLNWHRMDPVVLSAYVLWRLNYIHPFINGNGRTARACCYFILCVKSGGWLSGKWILPQLLKQERGRYVNALKEADSGYANHQSPDEFLNSLSNLIRGLLNKQFSNSVVS